MSRRAVRPAIDLGPVSGAKRSRARFADAVQSQNRANFSGGEG